MLAKSIKSNWLVLNPCQMLSTVNNIYIICLKAYLLLYITESFTLRVLRLQEVCDSLKLYTEFNVCLNLQLSSESQTGL